MTSFWPFCLCLCVSRAKVSPLVVATDASEWGIGVSRTSLLAAQGRVALQEHQQATPSCSGLAGSVELFAGEGGLRRAMERCGVPALHVAVEGEAAAQRVLQTGWPDVHLVDRVADLSNATLPQIVEKGPHVRIWIVGASFPSNLLTAHKEIPRLVRLLRQLVPEAQVAFAAPRTLMRKSGIAFRVH